MRQKSEYQKKADRLQAQRAAGWYLAIAGGAALVDALSKLAAIEQFTDNTVTLGSRFALMLVYNAGGAGGLSWGPHTWLINVCLTSVAILMISLIVTNLAKVDGRASIALGLVAGGAGGNLASMLNSPEGVPDFIALRLSERAIVCNIADLALWTGALCLAPVIVSLVRAIRFERAEKVSRAMSLARV